MTGLEGVMIKFDSCFVDGTFLVMKPENVSQVHNAG